MSGYSCSDCKAGELVVQTREIELTDGETISVLDSGVVIATRIACSNGDCDSHEAAEDEAEEGDKKPKRKKRRTTKHAAPAASGEECPKSELCDRSAGHTGRCNTKLAELVEA